MSTPSPSVRQRSAKKKTAVAVPESHQNGDVDAILAEVQKEVQTAVSSEWDYKVALAIITVLAFITRFYGISHPDQVVFDEVHFGKVCYWQHSCDKPRKSEAEANLIVVRITLPAEDLFLRCTPALWQAPLRFRWLVRWLQRRIPV